MARGCLLASSIRQLNRSDVVTALPGSKASAHRARRPSGSSLDHPGRIASELNHSCHHRNGLSHREDLRGTLGVRASTRVLRRSDRCSGAEKDVPTDETGGGHGDQTLFRNRAARVKGSKLEPAPRMVVWQGPLFCPRSAQPDAASWGQARARCINLRGCVVADRASSSGRR